MNKDTRTYIVYVMYKIRWRFRKMIYKYRVMVKEIRRSLTI